MTAHDGKKTILVAGGGVAGIEAAHMAARLGRRVIVVEPGERLGADVALLPAPCDAGRASVDFLAERIARLRESAEVEILTRAQLVSLVDAPGGFHAVVRIRGPRSFPAGPTELAAEGTLRQALAAAKGQNLALPEGASAAAGRLKEGRTPPPGGALEREVSAVVFAPPTTQFDASAAGEYGYGRWENVLTASDLESLLATGHLQRPSDAAEPESIAFLQCVGSRGVGRGAKPWCSALCCQATLKQALRLKELLPTIEIAVFYIDFMAVHRGCEERLKAAEAAGVRFIRSMPSDLKERPSSGDLLVRFQDAAGAVREEIFSMAVLAAGLHGDLTFTRTASALGLELDACGFIKSGGRKRVFSAGFAFGPMGLNHSAASGQAAAMEAVASCGTVGVARDASDDAERQTDVLVIGGGLAGMTAAAALSRWGVSSTLVESEDRLGGHLVNLRRDLSGASVSKRLAALEEDLRRTGAATVLTGTRFVAIEGSPGSFTSTIDAPQGRREVTHSVVIIATGAEVHTPGVYLYGRDERVLTQLELEAALEGEAREGGEGGERGEGGEKTFDDGVGVAMIQCVGSRDEAHPWCSRVCCAQAVKNALWIKESSPETPVWILHRDVRTDGLNDLLYHRARREGVGFVRFAAGAGPQVVDEGGRLVVKVTDVDLGDDVALEVGRVVLSAGVAPRGVPAEIAGLRGVEVDSNGFPRLAGGGAKGLDFGSCGVYLCGLARGGALLDESRVEALGAAAAAAAFVRIKVR